MALGLRILAGLFGLIFIWIAIQWITMPEVIAKQLGMPLWSGIGGSTQIGDFTSFFLVGGLLTLLGLRPGQSQLLLAPALLLSTAAVFRTWAWLYWDMAFAGSSIIFETVMASVLLAGFYYLPKLDKTNVSS